MPPITTTLAIDTATEACSAALLHDDKIAERYEIAPQKHNTLIFEMCDAVLADAQVSFDDLNALVFGRGPGAFTGVRIAASIAQALAYTKGIGLIPVSNLQTVAQIAADTHSTNAVCVAMDARMNEVYSACYQRDAQGIMQPVTEESVSPPNDIQIPDNFKCIGAGTGFQTASDALTKKLGTRLQATDPSTLPNAKAMLQIAIPTINARAFTSPNQALPQYLRHPLTK